MAQKFEDKIIARRHLLTARTMSLFDVDDSAVPYLLGTPISRCVRLNPLVRDPESTWQELTKSGIKTLEQDDLPPHCYVLQDPQSEAAEHVLQTLLRSGAVYAQNPSSFIPVVALNPQPSDRILDLCASPGGKTAYIAALTQNLALITANDNSYDRLQRLRRVCALLQVTIADFTMIKGETASKKFKPESFDKILLDAPCSGEDIRMTNKKDLDGWSPAKVKRLSELQKKLLKEAWKLLKPGGTLVYSTCSQAPEEDEAVVHWFLTHHSDAQTASITHNNSTAPALKQWNNIQYHSGIENAIRVKPNSTHISFFACKFIKIESLE